MPAEHRTYSRRVKRSESAAHDQLPDSVWRRCMFVVPLSVVGTLLAWTLVAALFANDEVGPVDWQFWLILASPLATFAVAAITVGRRSVSPSQGLLLVALSAVTSVSFAAIGLVLWLWFAHIACGDTYECPF